MDEKSKNETILEKFIEECFKDSKITTKYQLRASIGTVSVEIAPNVVQEVEIGLGAITNSPIVTFGDRHFCLGWCDIVALALTAGLCVPGKERVPIEERAEPFNLIKALTADNSEANEPDDSPENLSGGRNKISQDEKLHTASYADEASLKLDSNKGGEE